MIILAVDTATGLEDSSCPTSVRLNFCYKQGRSNKILAFTWQHCYVLAASPALAALFDFCRL